MICQRNLRQCLVAVVVLFTLPQPLAFAQQSPLPQDPVETNQISPQRLTIDQLKSKEILTNDTAIAKNQQDLYLPPQFNRNIFRSLTWKIRIPGEQLQSLIVGSSVPVSCVLQDNNGQANRLSGDANSKVNVAIALCEGSVTSTDTTNNTAVVQGRVQLQLDPSLAMAGTHIGKLLVCVKDKSGNGCP
jgi:hypothetical protein